MEKTTLLCFTDSSSSDSPLQSCRLHTTESDMDKNMKAIVILLEECGNSPEGRGGSNENKAQQIIYMLEEYHSSYQSLAEKYNHLSSILVNAIYSGSSSSSNTENSQANNSKMETFSRDFKSIAGCGSVGHNDFNFDIECLIKLRDELVSSMLCSRNFRWDNSWNELGSQVTMLMEESLKHQEELAKRNNEKREAIKELQQLIECLKSENRALQISLRFSKEELKPKRSRISKLSEMISNKILRWGS